MSTTKICSSVQLQIDANSKKITNLAAPTVDTLIPLQSRM